MNYKIINGESAEILKTYPDNHFDSVVTDPPYLIGFLGKEWDSENNCLKAVFTECLRVLKPGGYLLAFSAARTYHRIATMIEDSGFEIRDQIQWIYSSGMPKSHDVGRQLDKQARGKLDKQRFDESIMIKVNGDRYQHPDTPGKIYRKLPDINGDRLAVSHEGQEYGCVFEEVRYFGAKNESFVVNENGRELSARSGCIICGCNSKGPGGLVCGHPAYPPLESEDAKKWSGFGSALKPASEPIVMARKPMKQSIAKNCLEWGVGAINIDACRIPFEGGEDEQNYQKGYASLSGRTQMYDKDGFKQIYDSMNKTRKKSDAEKVRDWSPQRQQNRNGNGVEYGFGAQVGFETPMYNLKGRYPSNVIGEIEGYQKYYHCPKVSRKERHLGFSDDEPGNNHPTLKPLSLMDYLIKLVTPPGGHVLDPFNGSGSTGCAAVKGGWQYTGIDLDPHYCEISEKRIAAWIAPDEIFNKLFSSTDLLDEEE